MVKKSTDNKCRFYDKSHTYKVGNKKYESVTTLIHKHFPPFNEKKMARWLASLPFAKKQKKGVRYWLREWKNNRETGTLIHAELEKLINNPKEYEILKPVLHPRTIIAWEAFKKIIKNYEGATIEPEVLIYNNKYEVAGQIDVLIIKGNEITILDWKATKDISFHYKYNNEEEKYGTSDITMTLENCNGNHYNLQLSVYAYLLEQQGYKVKDLIIGHINPKTNSFNPITVPYLRYEAEGLLNDRYLNLSFEEECV